MCCKFQGVKNCHILPIVCFVTYVCVFSLHSTSHNHTFAQIKLHYPFQKQNYIPTAFPVHNPSNLGANLPTNLSTFTSKSIKITTPLARPPARILSFHHNHVLCNQLCIKWLLIPCIIIFWINLLGETASKTLLNSCRQHSLCIPHPSPP